MRLMLVHVGTHPLHQFCRTGNGLFYRSFYSIRLSDIQQMIPWHGVTIGHNRFVQHHRLNNHRRSIGQQYIRTVQQLGINKSTLVESNIGAGSGQFLVFLEDFHIRKFRMERNNPIPVLLAHQSLDGIKQMRSRSYIFGKRRRVQDYRTCIMRSMCTFLHESIRLAPASFIYLKEAVFPLKLLEGKSARFSLCAIDIEPSANRKMVILFIATLIDGVAMEKGDFHSREEIINIIARCKNSNRLIIHHFLDGLKPPLILGQQNRAV